jgi:hypothetical protein
MSAEIAVETYSRGKTTLLPRLKPSACADSAEIACGNFSQMD